MRVSGWMATGTNLFANLYSWRCRLRCGGGIWDLISRDHLEQYKFWLALLNNCAPGPDKLDAQRLRDDTVDLLGRILQEHKGGDYGKGPRMFIFVFSKW